MAVNSESACSLRASCARDARAHTKSASASSAGLAERGSAALPLGLGRPRPSGALRSAFHHHPALPLEALHFGHPRAQRMRCGRYDMSRASKMRWIMAPV